MTTAKEQLLAARERILRDHERGKLSLYEARRLLHELDLQKNAHAKAAR